MNRYLFIISILFVNVGFIQASCAQDPDYKDERQQQQRGITDPVLDGIIAHRGNSGDFPENTMKAFNSAISIGVDWVELDVHRTKDGKLVVIHDETTGRTGDRNLEVEESTYEQLLDVDVAYEYRQSRGLDSSEFPPQHIPLLEEVLELFLSQSRTKIVINFKGDVIEQTVDLVKNMEAEHMVGFLGGLNTLRTVKQLAPDTHAFYPVRDASKIEKEIKTAEEYNFESMLVDNTIIDESIIGKVKNAGIEAGTTTVNERHELKRLLQMGVERIITDHVSMLIELKRDALD